MEGNIVSQKEKSLGNEKEWLGYQHHQNLSRAAIFPRMSGCTTEHKDHSTSRKATEKYLEKLKKQ